MSTSFIAHLRQQLTCEHEAAQYGLSGLAMVASHQSIIARMEHAWRRVQTLHAAGHHQQALALLVSDSLSASCDEAESTTREAKRP